MIIIIIINSAVVLEYIRVYIIVYLLIVILKTIKQLLQILKVYTNNFNHFGISVFFF